MCIKGIFRVKSTHYRYKDGECEHRAINCEYFLLRNPIPRNVARAALTKGLGVFHRPPFNVKGNIQQGYLYHLGGKLARKDKNNCYPPKSPQKILSKRAFDTIFTRPIAIV